MTQGQMDWVSCSASRRGDQIVGPEMALVVEDFSVGYEVRQG